MNLQMNGQIKYDEGDYGSYESGKYQDNKETQTSMLYKDFE